MEQGVADFDLVAWFMLYAPAATPAGDARAAARRERRGAGAARAWRGCASRASSSGRCSADELAPFNQIELGKWAELVKRSGAQVD